MTDPNDLSAFLDFGWCRLTQGIEDQQIAPRLAVLATVSPDGFPEARTVVLRAADRALGQVEVHTDGGSDKIASLERHPCAQFQIWDAEAELQIRLSTTVTLAQGASVAHKWSRVPDGSRMAYGASPRPGTAIENAYAYRKLASESWFTVLT